LFSGNYVDLANKPPLFSGNYLDLANKPLLFSGNYNDLTNKPTLFSGIYNDLTNKPILVTPQMLNDAINDLKSQITNLKVELYDGAWITNDVGKFKDLRDEQVYTMVRIGTQIWMGQNLNFYASGTSYPNNDSVTYSKVYGRLYPWTVAKNSCPIGWHLPSETEFITMLNYLGATSASGGYPLVGAKLKEAGTSHWSPPNTNANNSAQFTAVPAGWFGFGTYNNLTKEARFWSSTEKINPNLPENQAAPFTLEYNTDYVRDYGWLANYQSHRLSVRCVKNN
jgi:uncharacterized protein (TIGR02145 family)